LFAFVPDVMLRSRVEGLAREAGLSARFFPAADALVAALPEHPDLVVPDLVVIDLSDARGMALLERLDGVRVLGFYAHTDDATRTRALELGARRVVPRSLLMKKFAALVSEVVA
jgi:DNA-binding NarL/FixJ family response regulator